VDTTFDWSVVAKRVFMTKGSS